MRYLSFIFAALFALSLPQLSAKAQTVETDFGAVELPTDEEINAQINEIDGSKISDAEKQQKLQPLINAGTIIDKYVKTSQQNDDFAKTKAQAPAQLKELEHELQQTKAQYSTVPDVSTRSADEISAKLTELNAQLQEVQENLADANADYTALQTLPNRAQNTIAKNNARISELSSALSATTALTDPLNYRVMALEHYTLELENTLLQDELSSQNVLQDLANYRIHINTIKNDYLVSYIHALQTAQRELSTAGLAKAQEEDSELSKYNAALQQQISANQQISSYIDKQLQDNQRLSQELQQVQTALNIVNQIEDTLDEQLSGVNGSLFLSRLLNRQQSEIPNVKISFNLDELIPNLNVWLYDLRSYRDELFDIDNYCAGLIAKYPELAQHQDDLKELMHQRRSLFDELYQSMSSGLSQAINLKIKNTELQQTTARVKGTINDHLFWLSSNLPLSTDFAAAFIPTLKAQLDNIAENTRTPGFWQNTFHTFSLLFFPLVVIFALTMVFKPHLKRRDDQLAMRLDRKTDGYLVTPEALLVRLGLAIPRIALFTALGAVFIFFALDTMAQQLSVVNMLILHLTIFIFFIEILKPNSIMQRHFCMPPAVIAKQRLMLDKLWLAIVPILIVANIREIDPPGISTDLIGYCLTLCCTGYITYIAVKFLKQEFSEKELSFMSWVKGLLLIIIPLTLFVMLALGYYYTVIKLVNRIAISLYTCILYIIISSTIRRELFVAENRMVRRMRAQHPAALQQKNGHSKKQAVYNKKEERQKQLDTLRLELINNKAFKLINGVLICLTAFLLYLQWNDLAGVLNYLDTIYLWKDESLVNGVITLNKSLSLADIIIAALVLVVTVILNRNLPSLMERMVMLKPNPRFKSTSYTVRILSSYIIIALGIVFAAGALGISWNNLQWLVAALSVGLGFGLQEIFANFVSGIIILFERQLRVGDIVTLNNLSGTVSKIRIRATTIVSFDNKEVLIPNREFITTALTNWSLSNTVTKVEFAIGVSYDADINKAKSILHQIVRGCKYLAAEKPYTIYVSSLDASCVTIMCEVFVNEIGNRKPTTDYLSTETLRRFAEAGIEIPFNQLDVKLKNLDNGQSLKIG
ncbi:MAG: mechanosensitive ion channel [Proteobacteria bacterium]|uniref:Mechanosensitive ion channel n=1 Tax=Candidatus Avisuccinivibrio stercorigallinarum TaxID=2840704 RepID=A0A9D9GSH9_9GAMM|nr:mechanosensitive ion channel [Candidatus Avisuccinivibrio stercorigallinarum]